jgi:hypothetical protein
MVLDNGVVILGPDFDRLPFFDLLGRIHKVVD